MSVTEAKVTVWDHVGRKLCAEGYAYNQYNDNLLFNLTIIVPYSGHLTHQEKLDKLRHRAEEKYGKGTCIVIGKWIEKTRL
jgi:cysteinyl-tRNA synthetase